MEDVQNQQRGQIAKKALMAYDKESGADLEDSLEVRASDLIADLFHLLGDERVVELVIDRARSHYETEVEAAREEEKNR